MYLQVQKNYLKVLYFNRKIINFNNLNSRFYHCGKEGVYGYRPKQPSQFKLSEDVIKNRQSESNFYRWVEAYRRDGHRLAQTNPIEYMPKESFIPPLDPARYGLTESATQNFSGIMYASDSNGSIKQAKELLEKLYCGEISMESVYIESEEEREWLIENYEKLLSTVTYSPETRTKFMELLLKSQVWDNFLGTKFPTVKRYGGEGAESMLVFFEQMLVLSVENGLSDIVLGMPHRGKLNLLTTMLKTRPAKIFRKLKGLPEFPEYSKAMGDIVSHFHVCDDLDVNGNKIHFTMLHNPSHLEAVNPVSMGKTRGKQQSHRDGAFSDDPAKQFSTHVLNIQLHGDAAFTGQGINQEMLMMAATPNFDIGGTIHMIVNNQIGYTTPSDRGRSTRYATDLAKSINAPVFHVNGDNPEAVATVSQLAFDYQRKFRKDVFIDFMCFRKWGHNELDDPTFTNPALYKIINSRDTVPNLYAKKLVDENIVTAEDVKKVSDSHFRYLNDELTNLKSYQPEAYYFKKKWSCVEPASSSITTWDTGMDYNILCHVGAQSVHYPENFTIHPHVLKTHVKTRLERLYEGTKIDWSTAEALALGSLMYQGHNVRMSGEDVGRGTFSQRHVMLVDQNTNEMYIPLNSLKHGDGGKLEVANSLLSEEAVLGFEYGMAIDNPNHLVIWEAQFGDFYNGAQIIIDTFIASGETKWMYSNGLVILLPHGYDGAGSEHSSSRMERFLQLTDSKETSPDGDDVNLQIINPTTPAQYFHALRRQIIRNFRKPLIVIGPKILLRLSSAVSPHTDFIHGTSFHNVIDDPIVMDKTKVKKVILCTGKHFYDLNSYRNDRKINDVAIVRIESLCPFPVKEINENLSQYTNAKVCIWSQEEHRNMGAWTFIKPRIENMCGKKIVYSGRLEAATTATGVSNWHKLEAEDVIVNPFKIQ